MSETDIREFGYEYGLAHLDILDHDVVNDIQARDLTNAETGIGKWDFYWFDCGVIKVMIENHLY